MNLVVPYIFDWTIRKLSRAARTSDAFLPGLLFLTSFFALFFEGPRCFHPCSVADFCTSISDRAVRIPLKQVLSQLTHFCTADS